MGFHFHSNFYQMVRLNLPLINPHITPFFLEEINGHEWIYNQISFFFIFEMKFLTMLGFMDLLQLIE